MFFKHPRKRHSSKTSLFNKTRVIFYHNGFNELAFFLTSFTPFFAFQFLHINPLAACEEAVIC